VGEKKLDLIVSIYDLCHRKEEEELDDLHGEKLERVELHKMKG